MKKLKIEDFSEEELKAVKLRKRGVFTEAIREKTGMRLDRAQFADLVKEYDRLLEEKKSGYWAYGLSIRTRNCLHNAGIKSLEDFQNELESGGRAIICARNFGPRVKGEILDWLEEKGYSEKCWEFYYASSRSRRTTADRLKIALEKVEELKFKLMMEERKAQK